MHELSICQQLLTQVARVAAEHGAARVDRIRVSAGPLSGVEPQLLQQAFTLARAGTIAAEADLEIRSAPVRIRCRDCRETSEVPPNRLLCPHCRQWQVDVVAGEELILERVELADLADDPMPDHPTQHEETDAHV